MSDAATSPNPAAYQLWVVMVGISPLIWRRLLIPVDTTIAGPHALPATQRKDPLAPDSLGLRLDQAKDLLAAVQDTLVVEQVATRCPPRSTVRTAGLRAVTRTVGPS